jgi:hypothetical protein
MTVSPLKTPTIQPANQVNPFAIAQLAFVHDGSKAKNSTFRYVNGA